MTVQLSYTKTMRPALNGQVAWDFGTADISSANVAAASIGFGVAAVKGAGSRTVIAGNVGVLGWTVRSLMSQHSINNAVEAYGEKETAAIIREGYVFVLNSSPTAVVEGAAVYVNAAGLLVNTGDVGSAIVPGCRVERGAASGAMCLLRVQTSIPA